jgi:hypothetical protein
MSFVESGIDRVRAFGLASGIGADGEYVNEPLSVLVKWRSEHEDKLHQVYVNGRFAGVTKYPRQRSMVVGICSRNWSAAQIKVYGVSPAQGDVDFSDEIEMSENTGRVRIEWPRYLSLPFKGTTEVFSDGGEGEVEYAAPVSIEPIQLWPCWQDKGGFGMSRFGRSDFGFDGSAAVGFGIGSFGYGDFGFDADLVTWESSELETGLYKFGVKITDRFGNDSETMETEQLMVIRSAKSAIALEVDSYDAEQGRLVLEVS